jgi:formamidopyrimidine-DNA glycosylase
MPELPEVETIKRELARKLVSKTISGVEVLWLKTVSPTLPKKFSELVVGKKVFSLERRAKMLVINLSNKISLAVHLKMTGQLIFVPKTGKIISGGHPTSDVQTPGRHTRLIFYFKSGDTLYFNDLRKFGWIRILDDKLKKYLKDEVGLEPLDRNFTLIAFKEILLRYPNRTVKQVLLDQHLIAGIGNIYADEAAYLSRVLPMRRIKKLSPKEIASLHKNIIVVLKFSIQKKGTSSKNYRRSNGEMGGFMPYLMVYGRKGERCKRCGTLIAKIKHAGRGTHYCPKCQKWGLQEYLKL